MSKVLYEKRDRIAYLTINRPEARNAIDPDVHRLMIERLGRLPRRRLGRRRDPHRRRRGVLRRGRPQDLHPADHRGREPARHPRDRRARPERLHARHAPDLEADHRRGQRLGAGRRPRDRAGLRHPDRLRARDVRLLRGAARLPPRRRRPGAAGQHLRRRRRAAHAAHRRADRRPAQALQCEPGHQGRPARASCWTRPRRSPARSCATRSARCARRSRRSST